MFYCFRVTLLNAVLLEALAFLARLPVVSGLVLRTGVVGRNIRAAVALLVQRFVLAAPSALGWRRFSLAGRQRAVPPQQSTVARLQRSQLLASAALAGSSQSGSWFALRAGVLRRAARRWGRPAWPVSAGRSALGRQDQCPSSAGSSSTSMKLPTVAALWPSPHRLASATNRGLTRRSTGTPTAGSVCALRPSHLRLLASG